MPRENRPPIVGAVGEPGAIERRVDARGRDPAGRRAAAKNARFWPRRQLGIEVELVREQRRCASAAPAPSRRAVLSP